LARELFKIELVPSALRLLGDWQFLARVAYAYQVFFPGTCPFAFLHRAMKAAPASMADPVLSLMPERNELPPAEAVLFALRRIEAAFDAQRVRGSSRSSVPFPSGRPNHYRLLTVAETRLKLQRIETYSEVDPGWAKTIADELYRETRKETRARKEAPILDRLTGLVRKVVSDHDGEWTTLPSLESIAKTFRVSRRTVQITLNRLRETSVEFAFHAEPRLDTTCADRRGRCVRVAFSSWLKHDHKPLLFDFQGKERGIRTSFRPDSEILTPGPASPAPCAEPSKEQINAEVQAAEAWAETTFFSEPAPVERFTEATKCNIRLSYSVRLDEPAEFLPNLIQESHHQIGQKPGPSPPDLKGCDRNKTFRASWGLARELRRGHFGDWDEDHNPLSYHRWRFELPLFVIRDIIADAQQDGVAPVKIKVLFESACYETNAAVFDGLAKNAGGLFRSVFRRRCAGTGRKQSVVRQSEPLKISREPCQVMRQIKSVESTKPAHPPAPVEANIIDIASKLRAFRLSMNSISAQRPTGPFSAPNF
jgi:hypothetical protein